MTVPPSDASPTHRELRVALVTETWPPEVNGVAQTIARVAQGLRGRGHRVLLARPRQTAQDRAGIDELLLPGLPIPRYPQLKLGLPATGALMERWRRQRPDIVHIATEGPLGWSALQAASRLRLPVSSDFRTNFDAYSRHYGVGWLQRPIAGWLRRFHNRAGCTMVPTEPLRARLAAAGFERLVVVARGVDTRRFDPCHRDRSLRQRWGAGPDDLVVCCVGRLAAEKNLGLLLRSFEALRRDRPSAKLVLVGDGPQRDELQARFPDTVFAGTQAGHDLAAHYASADLFVFPSLTETFGNVVPEAMASGLGVLAFRAAAAGQLIRDGVDGALVPPGDDDAFVARARLLATDPAGVRRLGKTARQTTLSLDWDTIVHEIEQVFLMTMLGDGAPHLTPALGTGWGLQTPS